MRIIEQPRRVRRDPTVVQSAHQMLITLALGERVRTGTPIRPAPNGKGWVVAPNGTDAWAFAATSAQGGETIGAWRSVTLEYPQNQPGWESGKRVRVADIDDLGHLLFVPDPDGPYVILAPHRVLLVPTR